MKKSPWAYKILAVLPIILLLSACNALENKTKSASFIIVDSILGTDAEGNEANYLQSDVREETADSSTIIADIATATLRASLLDPASILKPSQYNDVMIDRYVVSYTRTDGKDRQGVDVPYTFEGSLSQILKIGTGTSFSLVIVREVAKMEPPLSNLVSNRDEGVLQVTARIDFYGHDLANHKVTATGFLPVFFANYADETAAAKPSTWR